MQPALHAQFVTSMLLATILHSKATTARNGITEYYLPTTDVGEDGALEIILKHSYYKYYFLCLDIKYQIKLECNMLDLGLPQQRL
jgi:hypothetical protein